MTKQLLIGAISNEANRLADRVVRHVLCSAASRTSDFSAGLFHESRTDSHSTSLLAFTKMLTIAADQSGRSTLGLDMAASDAGAARSIFGDLFVYAPTLREALDALARYFPVSQTGSSVRLIQTNDLARLSYQIHDPAVAERLHDAAYTLGKLCRSIRRSAGPGWRPELVTLAAPAPRFQDPYPHFFRAPVIFDAPCSGLQFSAAALDQPIATANPRRYEDFCAQLELRMPDSHDAKLLRDALLTWLAYATRDGTATLEHAAADFGVTPRTMQRRLKDEGIRFQDLLTQVRMSAARRLLTENRMPVTGIAHQLGFSETSAFTRAFRNYTRQSPRAYRQAALARM